MESSLIRLFLVYTSFFLAKAYILRLPCITLADFAVIHKDRSLTGHVIREISGIDDLECTKQCSKNRLCKSYNFQFALKICQLNDRTAKDIGSRLFENQGWVYKSTDYNETKIGPVCKSLNPCKKDVLCKDKCTPPYFECIYCKKDYHGLHCQFHKAINGSWSTWGAFGDCNRQCGGGTRTRYRSCNEPAPAFGGEPCTGNEAETASCNTEECPEHIGCYQHRSNETNEGSTLPFLLDDHIECPGQTSVLRQFRYRRGNAAIGLVGFYDFNCCEFNSSVPYTTNRKTTDFVGIGNDVRLLAQHKLSCENNSLIRNMKFERSSDQQQFRYTYDCYMASNLQYQNQTICYSDSTGWNDNANGNVVYLDRHNVVCSKSGFTFNEIQLKIKPGNQWKWRYEFRCCKILFW